MKRLRLTLGCLLLIVLSARSFTQQRIPSKPKTVRVSSRLASGYNTKRVLPRGIGVAGEVVVDALVSENGQVLTVRGLKGDKRLQELARTAVMKWAFMPIYWGGKPLRFVTSLEFRFQGDEGSAKLILPADDSPAPPRSPK